MSEAVINTILLSSIFWGPALLGVVSILFDTREVVECFQSIDGRHHYYRSGPFYRCEVCRRTLEDIQAHSAEGEQ